MSKYKRNNQDKASNLCLNAMKHLADRYNSRSYDEIATRNWADYVAIRLLDALYHLNTITESLGVPVSWGFQPRKK